MAITHSLLQSSFNSTPLRSFPTTQWSRVNNISLKRNYSLYIKASFSIKCFVMNHHKPHVCAKNRGGDDDNDSKILEGVIWRSSMENAMKVLQVPVITGVLLGLLFLFDHHDHCPLALAATGGRMGGSSFSSESSSSSSSYSSGNYSFPSSSSSSYDSSYDSSSSYISLTSSPAPMRTPNETKQDVFDNIISLTVCIVAFYFIIKFLDRDDKETAKTSIVMLQVGSIGTGKLLQRDLNRIAESADTSTSKGFTYVLQETILALLRHSDFCISCYSSVDVKRSAKEAEKRYNQLSIEERGKFDEETLVNINNIRKRSATSRASNGLRNEYIVVTIIVAASGVLKLPPIKSASQLKKALQELASVPSRSIMGAEVLWTPQKEDDSLTEQEMLKDFPLLHPL